MTNRRGFLTALLGGATSAMALDPEFGLWTPGKKLISIPKPVAQIVATGDIYCWYLDGGSIFLLNGLQWLKVSNSPLGKPIVVTPNLPVDVIRYTLPTPVLSRDARFFSYAANWNPKDQDAGRL